MECIWVASLLRQTQLRQQEPLLRMKTQNKYGPIAISIGIAATKSGWSRLPIRLIWHKFSQPLFPGPQGLNWHKFTNLFFHNLIWHKFPNLFFQNGPSSSIISSTSFHRASTGINFPTFVSQPHLTYAYIHHPLFPTSLLAHLIRRKFPNLFSQPPNLFSQPLLSRIPHGIDLPASLNLCQHRC